MEALILIALSYLAKIAYLTTSTIVALFLAWVISTRYKQLPYYNKLMKFPHEFEAIPLLNNLKTHFSLLWIELRTGVSYRILYLDVILSKIERFRREGCFALFIGSTPLLLLFRADHVEKFLGTFGNISKGTFYDVLEPWLGTGLLMSTGQRWKQRRKMLTPSFHFSILEGFSERINQQAKIFLARMQSKEPTEDIAPYVSALTLDILCETVMGLELKSQTSGRGQQYLQSLKTLLNLLIDRLESPTQWIDWVYKWTPAGRKNARVLAENKTFTDDVIAKRKVELDADPEEFDRMAFSEDGLLKSKKPFLDRLLVEHVKRGTISADEVRDEVQTFMFGGHDTTSIALTWAIYMIGLHEDVQRRLHQEIDEVFHGDLEMDVTDAHIKEMKYLDMTLKETLRLFPSAPVITRKVTEEIYIAGRRVPAGVDIVCHLMALHRDPDVFPDPLKFDPDRFAPENCAGRNPYAYIPFSAGPRNCIGQRFALLSMKIILIWFLRKFRIKSLDKQDKIHMVVEVVLAPRTPIRVECVVR